MRATDEELESLICNLIASEYGGDRDRGRTFSLFEMTYISTQPLKLTVSGQFGDGRQISLTVTPDLIIGAFIIFCTNAGIPISRRSVKSVSRDRNGIAFDMVVRNLEFDAAGATSDPIDCAFLPATPNDFKRRFGAGRLKR